MAQRKADRWQGVSTTTWTNVVRGDYLGKANGELVSVRRDKSGYWYAFRGSELLGRAGCLRRFTSATEARDAVDLCAAGSDGWEWIAWPD